MSIPSSSAISESARNPILDHLVEKLTDRIQAGEPIDLENLIAEHPEHAEQIRSLMPALEVLADLGRSAARGVPLAPGPHAEMGVLGDFRVLREIGRGGMGVVYEAEQISLGRRVALKVLPFAAALDPRQLQRFKVEAQAAAQLHHTHIVPVFSVGVERGVHYYAMQFIEGRPLSELIRELARQNPPGSVSQAPAEPDGSVISQVASAPATDDAAASPSRQQPVTPATPLPAPWSSGVSISQRPFFEASARLGIEAAEALDYAHSLGVVHRDIKPANFLLDARGQLWVTDFGLARFHAEAGLTMTGDVLGTLRYMSPEQALARRTTIDHRTDVYSLGVTLYELLTLQPALTGRDRQELLRQIAFEEPPPPRRLNPAIPRELETVVLKAMAKEPADRYATAQELADDLRRFLEHRPILARRPTLPEHASKWARRHMTVVVAAFVLLLMAVAGLSVGAVLLARKQTEIERQRNVAQERLQLARRAVDEMFTRVGEDWLSQRPELEPLQVDFLRRSLEYYEAFARAGGRDPKVRHGMARAYGRVADIRRRFGELREAEDAYQRALSLFQGLVDEFPKTPEFRRDLALTLEKRALLFQDRGRLAEAEDSLLLALKHRESLLADEPGVPEDRRWHAGTLEYLGRVLFARGKLADSEPVYRRSIEECEALVSIAPRDQSIRLRLASTHRSLGQLLQARGRPEEALQAHRLARERADELVAESPGRDVYRFEAMSACLSLGQLLVLTGRPAEAEPICRRAVELAEPLAAQFPSRLDYRESLGSSYNNLGMALEHLGRHTEAEAAYQRDLEISRELVAKVAGNPRYLSGLGATLNNRATQLKNRGDLAEAKSLAEEAIANQRAALKINPRNPTYRRFLANHLSVLGELEARLGGDQAASRALSDELALMPDDGARAYDAARILIDCAARAERDTRLPVDERRARAQAHRERAQAWLRDAARLAAGRSEVLNAVAWLRATCPDTTIRDPMEAARLAEDAVRIAPQDGAMWNTLGVAQFRAGHWNRCIEALERSMDLRSGGDASDWFVLAMAYARRGEKVRAQQWFDKAIAWFDENHPKDEDLKRFRDEAAALLGVTAPANGNPKEESRPMPQ